MFPPLLFVAACGLACAQEDQKTDLQQDALLGPVKSVSTSRISEAEPEMEKRIGFSVPSTCQFCEYDGDGNRITNGRIADGDFFGDRTVIQRNSEGLLERITTTKIGPLPPNTATPPPLIRYDLAGPFGIVDSKTVQGGVLSHQTRVYDAKGHVLEVRVFDSNGPLSREVYRWTEDGQRTELDTDIYAKGHVQRWQLTWDPETDVNRYTCFEQSGALLESWATQSGKVLSFWEASDEPGPCAHYMYEDGANGHLIHYSCQKGTECKVSHSYSTYVGPGKQNLRHTDFLDSTGKLKWASDYRYEFDSKGNWTHRKVWVTIAGDPAPVLFAEDVRTITYWDE